MFPDRNLSNNLPIFSTLGVRITCGFNFAGEADRIQLANRRDLPAPQTEGYDGMTMPDLTELQELCGAAIPADYQNLLANYTP
jgi:hypothetical protein